MRYRMGVDVGGTNIKAGLIDENYNIIKKESIKTPDSFESAMKALADLVYTIASGAGISISDLPCIGVGVPCSVIKSTGHLVFANNTGWKNVSIIDELKKHIPIPVYADNDANCAVTGETIAGAAKGVKNVVMITIGTGVGGGIIIDGKLFAGADGLGAELGHTPLIYGGIQCSCGLPGCFERYASATALVKQTTQAIADHPESSMSAWVGKYGKVSARTAFECAEEGDPTAISVIDQFTSYIAGGLTGFTNIFRPELILIGGGISNEGDNLLKPIREKVRNYTLAYDIVGGPVIEKAALGNDAGIIGAACLDRVLA